MPISKTGNLLIHGLKGVGRVASKSFMPLMIGADAFGVANAVASGEQSLGEAVGESAGGWGGFALGNRLARKIPRVKYLSPVLNVGVPMLTGMAGSIIGGKAGNAIAPWQRGQGARDQLLSGGSQGYPPQTPEDEDVQIG